MTCVTASDDPHARDRAIDRIVLSRRFGIPSCSCCSRSFFG